MSDYIPFDIQRNKKLSHSIPFDIQSEIMKRLPVKSLIQFRSVSKLWRSLIDSAEFIKNYHINHTNPQHHLFVRYELDNVQTYTSIIDNHTFPQQKFTLTPPKSLSLLRGTLLALNSVNGLLCLCGRYEGSDSKTSMVVIWNPTLRKSVSILIPIPNARYFVVGFGVCRDTCDPKLVKIIVAKKPSMWEVEVFTLSTRVWKTVYVGAPFKLCDLVWFNIFVNGVIYFRGYDDLYVDQEVRSNFVMAFDLKSEKFGEVRLPEILVHAPNIDMATVNESLGLLEYYFEGDTDVCGVWSRKDGANKPFTKIYTVKVESKGFYIRVLQFRNNGDVVMERMDELMDDDYYDESGIEVYEPMSGHTNRVGIIGKAYTFSARSYMETLLLLNEPDCIIH